MISAERKRQLMKTFYNDFKNVPDTNVLTDDEIQDRYKDDSTILESEIKYIIRKYKKKLNMIYHNLDIITENLRPEITNEFQARCRDIIENNEELCMNIVESAGSDRAKLLQLVSSHFLLKPCLHCSNHSELRCILCGGHYCSKKCQKSDWKKHKKICNTK